MRNVIALLLVVCVAAAAALPANPLKKIEAAATAAGTAASETLSHSDAAAHIAAIKDAAAHSDLAAHIASLETVGHTDVAAHVPAFDAAAHVAAIDDAERAAAAAGGRALGEIDPDEGFEEEIIRDKDEFYRGDDPKNENAFGAAKGGLGESQKVGAAVGGLLAPVITIVGLVVALAYTPVAIPLLFILIAVLKLLG